MKANGITLHILLAAVAGGLTYWAWSRPSTGDGAVVPHIFNAPVSQVEMVKWSGNGNVVLLEPSKNGYQITVTSKPKLFGKKEVETETGDKTIDVPESTTEIYRGTKKSEEVVERLSKLKAVRSLGALDDKKEKAFGLDAARSTLTLKIAGREKSLSLGNTAYGSGNFYAVSEGQVFLVDGSGFRELQGGAGLLIDRRAVTLERTDITKATMKFGDQTLEVVQRNSGNSARAYFADPAEPDTRLPGATLFLNQLLNAPWAERVEAPKPGVELAYEVTFFADANPLGTMRWARSSDEGAVFKSSLEDSHFRLSPKVAEAIDSAAIEVFGKPEG